MSIELHCPQCQKLIRAPDSAGGQHGKCPYCGNKVYIPTPPGEFDEIALAPLEEEDERRERELRRESIRYASAVGHAMDAGPAGELGSGETPGEVVDLGGEIEAFILAMRDSKLDEADAATARLRTSGNRACDYVQGLLVDEMPPQFENVPPPVVLGFLKTLLARLK
jgi:hypothetical protein